MSVDVSGPARNVVVDALGDYLDSDRGVFVEAGAHDGLTLSNSVRLERERGWTGLLIEPVAELAQACRVNRPGAIVEQAALVGPDHDGDRIGLTFGNLQTLVRGSRATLEDELAYATAPSTEQDPVAPYSCTATARTLSSLLDQHQLPDVTFLSLDLEGYEPLALRGLELARHKPEWILLEVWSWTDQPIRAFLADDYEQVAVLSCAPRSEAQAMSLPGIRSGSSWDALFHRRAPTSIDS